MFCLLPFGELSCTLYPEILRYHNGKYIREKHPDLFAASFAEYAIRLFQEEGRKISSLKTQWNKDSTNYKQFYEGLRRGYSELKAADDTWSGRVIAKNLLGFQCTEVIHDPGTNDNPCIVARYT